MRTKEEFKRYVYARAEEKSSAFKKQKAAFFRGIAAFSVLFIVGGVWLYGNRDISVKNDINETPPATFSMEKREVVAEAALVAENASPSVGATFAYGLTDQNDEDDGKSASPEMNLESGKGAGVKHVTSEEVLEIAENECTVAYNSTSLSYDYETQLWKVVFYTEGVAGGCQTVFVDDVGDIVSIIYGE